MNPLVYRFKKQLLWLKHSYRFRWAHDPLCDRLGGGVMRIGKTPTMHLCRSCVIVYSVAVIAVLATLFSSEVRELSVVAFFGSVMVAVLLSAPPIYNQLPRILKYIARASLGLAIGLIPAAVLSNALWVVPSLMVLLVIWKAYGRIRKTIKDQGCVGCPELKPNHVCSGFEIQVEGARAFEEEATVLFLQSGQMPVDLSERMKV